jgi:large subunit ribosomal protein L30
VITVASKLKITQVRSTIGCKQNQRATLLSLGLRKIRQSVDRDDTPQIRGMIRTVRHLVAVEELAASGGERRGSGDIDLAASGSERRGSGDIDLAASGSERRGSGDIEGASS